MTTPFPPEKPATVGVIADVLAGLSRLVRGEITLAKAEAAQALNRVLRAAGFILLAVVLAVVGLAVLAEATIAALIAAGVPPTMANLTVAVALLVVAFGLVRLALRHLDAASRFADRSARNLSRDLKSIQAGGTSHAST